MKKLKVKSLSGGGGSRSTAIIKRASARQNCHAELVSASVQCSEEKLSRKIQQKTLCREEKRFPCLLLKVSPDRSRNEFGMTVMGVIRAGFTMAEILLSLTIIGVVAAITLPSLTGNINERTWNTQRKALYARFSQAVPLIDSLNGYTNGEAFVTAALNKVMKINNICDKDHLADCGIASKFTNLTGSQFDIPKTMEELNPTMTSVSFDELRSDGTVAQRFSYSQDSTDAVAFETGNGESVVVFYNPNCRPDMDEVAAYYVQPKICAHFIYDLNGSKGPNTVNKDIGWMTAIYSTGSVVAAPYVNPQDASSVAVFYDEAAALCTQQDVEYRMPNKYELMSMMVARKMIGESKFYDGYNTSALLQHQNTNYAWRLYVDMGQMAPVAKYDGKYKVRCVKR